MSWVPVTLLALVAFAVAVVVLRLPKASWTTLGAALLFGLAGYALQGRPGLPDAPRPAIEQSDPIGPAMIQARRELFGVSNPPGRFVVIADGYARRGRYADAIEILRGAIEENPRDAEAWIALGNALVEHAEGNLTPPAMYSYAQAAKADPTSPAAPYFLGIAFLRAEQPERTQAIWRQMVEDAPPDAEWLPVMRERLKRLDQLLAGLPGE